MVFGSYPDSVTGHIGAGVTEICGDARFVFVSCFVLFVVVLYWRCL